MNNKNIFLFLSFVILCFIFNSCGKIEKVSGVVINVFDRKPIAHIKIIAEAKNQSVFKDKPAQKEDQVETDENGSFDFTYYLRKRKYFGYRAYVSLPDMTDSTDAVIDTVSAVLESYSPGYSNLYNLNTAQAVHNDGKEIEFRLAPAARVKILSWNATPFDENDQLVIYTYNRNGDSASIHYARGRAIYVHKYFFIPSNGFLPVKCFVTKNSKKNMYQKRYNLGGAIQEGHILHQFLNQKISGTKLNFAKPRQRLRSFYF